MQQLLSRVIVYVVMIHGTLLDKVVPKVSDEPLIITPELVLQCPTAVVKLNVLNTFSSQKKFII